MSVNEKSAAISFIGTSAPVVAQQFTWPFGATSMSLRNDSGVDFFYSLDGTATTALISIKNTENVVLSGLNFVKSLSLISTSSSTAGLAMRYAFWG